MDNNNKDTVLELISITEDLIKGNKELIKKFKVINPNLSEEIKRENRAHIKELKEFKKLLEVLAL